MDQVPVYTVEKPGFRQLLGQLNNKYALSSRNHFMLTEIPALYDETKDKIMESLRGKPFFSCTTDLWTSRATSTFMAVTLQFIIRFKDSFVTLREEVKQNLMDNVRLPETGPETGSQSQQTPSPPGATAMQPAKKTKTDLNGLLTSIQGEKKSEHGEDASEDADAELKNEFTIYEKMPELSAGDDPLTWWRTHEKTLTSPCPAGEKVFVHRCFKLSFRTCI